MVPSPCVNLFHYLKSKAITASMTTAYWTVVTNTSQPDHVKEIIECQCSWIRGTLAKVMPGKLDFYQFTTRVQSEHSCGGISHLIVNSIMLHSQV